MNVSSFKKGLVQVLFALAVLSLVANLVTAKYFKKSANVKEKDLGANIINEQFLTDLQNFGLKKEWIDDKSNARSNKNNFSYKVKVPKDLPIPVVLSEIYGSFYSSDVNIRTIEKIIGGTTVINIYLKNQLKLTAELNYDENIKRDAGNIGLIILDLEKLNAKDIDDVVQFPQTLAAAVTPSKEAVQISSKLINHRKEYAVLLNDNIKGLDYKLDKSYSEVRLKLTIRSIVGDFPDAVFFMVDNKSKIYNSPAYQIIKNELLKREIKIFNENSFSDVEEGNSETVKSNFRKYVEKTHLDDYRLVSIHADDFYLLKPEILSLIKIGYKFITPSIILSRYSDKLKTQ